jgi:predicted  nucleic acid-binding Zn-ribbon protein
MAHSGSEPAAVEPAATAPATAAEPTAPKMKRIRVKYRFVVEGQVVREEVVEREVPADADMAQEARRIQEELARADAAQNEITRLPSGEEVEVRRRVEDQGR